MPRLTQLEKGIVVLLVTVMAMLPACTTLDPYTQEEKTSNATKGVVIGAAAGVAVGLLTGDGSAERKKRALIGAGDGALAGGGIGVYMDNQELKLRKELEGTGVSVTRIGDNITLNMPGNVTFAFDSVDISAQFYPVLNSVGKVLQEFDKTFVEVAGHTDSIQSRPV
jgi:outer membrane protein OmpA-like peptidoglycan-associated protein